MIMTQGYARAPCDKRAYWQARQNLVKRLNSNIDNSSAFCLPAKEFLITQESDIPTSCHSELG